MANQILPSEDRLHIIDKITGKEFDILKVVLLECCDKSHIPELYEIFGRENFLKFIDIFAGSTIKCPSREVLDKAVRDVTVYLLISKSGVGNRSSLVRDLAVQYGVTVGVIRQIYVEMQDRLNRYNLE
jgi:hypothetical protein